MSLWQPNMKRQIGTLTAKERKKKKNINFSKVGSNSRLRIMKILVVPNSIVNKSIPTSIKKEPKLYIRRTISSKTLIF